jgi:hypothetical protein
MLCLTVISYIKFRNVIIFSTEWCYSRFSTRVGSRVHVVEPYIDISMNGMCVMEPQWLAHTVTVMEPQWLAHTVTVMELQWLTDTVTYGGTVAN